jgi:excisionase family DNA binding protein
MTDAAPQWLTVTDLAHRLGVPVSTVRFWRAQGAGPRGCLLGRHVRFNVEDVEAWENAHRSEAEPRG